MLEQLAAVEDKTRVVVLARDGEGNGYRPLDGLELSRYDADEEAIGLEILTDEAKAQGYSDEDVMEGGVPALVLWPTY